jgi:hypothetical protein
MNTDNANQKPKKPLLITGKVKKETLARTSAKGKNYFIVPIEIHEAKEGNEIVDYLSDSIVAIFWEDSHDSATKSTVEDLKKDQIITVYGELTGENNGLIRVKELTNVEGESDADIFI